MTSRWPLLASSTSPPAEPGSMNRLGSRKHEPYVTSHCFRPSSSASPPAETGSSSQSSRHAAEASLNHWTISAAQDYAENIFYDMLERTADVHTACTPTDPQKRMSYSATIKAMEVAYRAFIHATMSWKANLGVRPPEPEMPPATGKRRRATMDWKANFGVRPPEAEMLPEVARRRAEFKGLYRSVLHKLEVSASTNTSRNQARELVAKMLEDNLNRCIWQYISSTASHVKELADTKKIAAIESSRTIMEELLALSPSA